MVATATSPVALAQERLDLREELHQAEPKRGRAELLAGREGQACGAGHASLTYWQRIVKVCMIRSTRPPELMLQLPIECCPLVMSLSVSPL